MNNCSYTGCSSDVIRLMDAKCSGRETCTYKVSALAESVTPCNKDFTSYLEISYMCLQGGDMSKSRTRLIFVI